MGESDWWICQGCKSLNNLSAKKCYSCRRAKPKDPIRATEFLGYVPIVSWDGKVAMNSISKVDLAHRGTPGAMRSYTSPKPPPLREPVRRDTLAVAPRPPDGARIEYREAPAPLMAIQPVPPMAIPPAPPMAIPPAPPPPLPVVTPPQAMPAAPAPPQAMSPPALPPPPPVAMGPVPGEGRPVVAIPIVPDPPYRLPVAPPDAPPPDESAAEAIAYLAQLEEQHRAHWRELLDVRPPAGLRQRLERAASDVASGEGDGPGGRHDRLAMHKAINAPRPVSDAPRAESEAPRPEIDEPPEAVPWPAVDLDRTPRSSPV